MRSPSTDTVGAPLSAALAAPGWDRQPTGLMAVEGLRMDQPHTNHLFAHQPVMVDEVVTALSEARPRVFVDATVGGAGHSLAMVRANPGLRVIAFDRDPAAVAVAQARLGDNGTVHHLRFDQIRSVVDSTVDAILFDLGVSSPQLDVADRGFSYRHNGPLDMRMDPTQGLTAADVVNTYSEQALAALIRENGEGRFASRIARAIIAARPVPDTVTLAGLVRDAIPAPARRRGGHPATRVFQAIRIEVNGELAALRPALEDALALLAPGGRLAVLTYHSGEDRIVKDVMRTATTGGCVCPPGLPCVCGAVSSYAWAVRSKTPTATEREHNPRAASARLRIVSRVEPSETSEPGSGD